MNKRLCLSLGCAILSMAIARAVAETGISDLRIGYLYQQREPIPGRMYREPDDIGIAGVRLGHNDNQASGAFSGRRYHLLERRLSADEDARAAATELLVRTRYLIVDLPAGALLDLAAMPEAHDALIVNVGAADDRLRDRDCRANIVHTLPSHAMRADALAQYLVVRRWRRIAMVEGDHPDDQAFAAALRRSITTHRLRIAGSRKWDMAGDVRRDAARDIPPIMQRFKNHDVVIVADEADRFGRFIPFNTWRARPVAGSAGLRPVAFSPAIERWGALQLLDRFERLAGRLMQPRDYAAWLAVRAIAEAVSGARGSLRMQMLSDQFSVAGFVGRPLSFRAWNGQLRQPIFLVHDGAVSAVAPFEGFLHPGGSDMDTLGLDAAESRCRAFDSQPPVP